MTALWNDFQFGTWKKNIPRNSMGVVDLPTLRIPKDPPMEGLMNLFLQGCFWVLKIAIFEGLRDQDS